MICVLPFFHVSHRTLRPAMMLMTEMLTPNQDTRSGTRTGNLAKAATWQHHDKELILIASK